MVPGLWLNAPCEQQLTYISPPLIHYQQQLAFCKSITLHWWSTLLISKREHQKYTGGNVFSNHFEEPTVHWIHHILEPQLGVSFKRLLYL